MMLDVSCNLFCTIIYIVFYFVLKYNHLCNSGDDNLSQKLEENHH